MPSIYPAKRQNKAKIPIKTTKNPEKCTFFAFFFKNIWSYQKKAVPLHPLSNESDVL